MVTTIARRTAPEAADACTPSILARKTTHLTGRETRHGR
jgi:hypothetical protein